MSNRINILIVAGARPNFMKISPLMRSLSVSKKLRGTLVHTGQHYDDAMSGSFFRELGIPEPEINLQVGAGTQTRQTAEIMQRFEPVLDDMKPRAVLVVGDVNSTLACALVAAKKRIPVIHVEAGLRSFDRDMPEEINRVLTDQISDFLFTTEREANENLEKENIAGDKIHFVGNVMVDSVENNLKRAVPVEKTLAELNLSAFAGNFCVVTLHRPSNVDNAETLGELIGAMSEISKALPVVFSAHPRTNDAIKRFSLQKYFDTSKMALIPPLPYLSMLGLLKSAKLVMTDSGGLQEETTALGVPCFTLRENTERWITVREGTNVLVGASGKKLLTAFADFKSGKVKKGARPEFWDGKASQRIIAVLEEKLAG